jgi:hypothetical protein
MAVLNSANDGCDGATGKGRPPPGGDGGRQGVRLRGGRAEPAQRSRGVQPPRVKLNGRHPARQEARPAGHETAS